MPLLRTVKMYPDSEQGKESKNIPSTSHYHLENNRLTNKGMAIGAVGLTSMGLLGLYRKHLFKNPSYFFLASAVIGLATLFGINANRIHMYK